jgi:hypothetical protein
MTFGILAHASADGAMVADEFEMNGLDIGHRQHYESSGLEI